ncbi:hypothetical protein R6Q57_016496 [Mikania cordata]
MPRPGPRPYECVRRAWHSDRHQPMRGSLIQEIFRVVNEIHSSATRKNKEWQDNLPIVVLKAEEIMYSKANSQAEYMDLETLWDRANDAINTIIRLDETTETGVFLQPCIEAALNLGCTPMRTSRSQRNNSATYYLTNKNNSCPSNNLHKTTQETIYPFGSHYSLIRKPCSINLSQFNLKPQITSLPNDKSLRNKFSFPSPPSTKAPSVYPLYYGSGIDLQDPKIGYGAPYGELKETGEMGFVHKPSFCNHKETGDMGFVQNLSFCNHKENGEMGFVQNLSFGNYKENGDMGFVQSLSFCKWVSKNNATEGDLRYTSEKHSQEHDCDLSLRLGPSLQSQLCNVGKSKKCNFESEN